MKTEVYITACILICCSKMMAQIPFPDDGSFALYLQKKQKNAIEAQIFQHLKIRTINELHYNSKSLDDTIPSGHVITVIDSLGRESVNLWNSEGTVKTYFFYDTLNNEIESRIPKLRHSSKNNYDDFNCISSITTIDTSNIDRVKIKTIYLEYARDNQKRVKSIFKKGENGSKITKWNLFYDRAGRIVKEEICNLTDSKKQTFHFTYTTDSLLLSCETEDGQKIIYEYTNKRQTKETHIKNDITSYHIVYVYTDNVGLLEQAKKYSETGKLIERVEYKYE